MLSCWFERLSSQRSMFYRTHPRTDMGSKNTLSGMDRWLTGMPAIKSTQSQNKHVLLVNISILTTDGLLFYKFEVTAF